MRVKYCGPAKDYSGYGEANRHDILALLTAGLDVSVELTKHCLEISDFGQLGKLVDDHVDLETDYKIKILHTTPNIFGKFIEPGKYHIGRVFWETDKLPPSFAAGAQLCDEIWTGSEFNAQAIRNAGVTKPIRIIPEVINTDMPPEIAPFENEASELFTFYSIFEWTERKNPKALLEAFFREFEGQDNVALVLKTYVDRFTDDKKKVITDAIEQVKTQLNLKSYAPVFLYLDLMNREQIYRFHQTFDCFVSAHRGEGWGIPQMEAMLMGKPVISTNCGGIHEYLKHGDNALLVSHKLINIVENSRNQEWYSSDQKWADVDMDDLRKNMRYVFENQEAAQDLGIQGQEAVFDLFSPDVVGETMRSRLEEIDRSLT